MNVTTMPTTTKLWMPERVLITPEAAGEAWGRQMVTRVAGLGLPMEYLKNNRVMGLQGATPRESYRLAKQTLVLATAPPGSLKLEPIPPSADWQFHLAKGCPAHCQYCYLAGSLPGAPATRVYANLPEILANLQGYEKPDGVTTYEASCYTDPLGIEHLTGSLAETIRYFGTRPTANLRWVTKYDNVESLIDLPHNGRTRCRFSVNALPLSRQFDVGTPTVAARLQALRQLALPRSIGGGGYPVGLVIAPIMPFDDWQLHYSKLLDAVGTALDFECDLTFELITHRFTPNSKAVLTEWYPNSKLPMDEADRSVKRGKMGGTKYVYPAAQMKTLKQFFEREIAHRFPDGQILYWT